MDPVVNETIVEYLKKHFRELTVTRGKRHTFLGINSRRKEDQNRNNGNGEVCNRKFWINCVGKGTITIGATFANCERRGWKTNSGYEGNFSFS